ncbi:TonB-dependent receptor [Hymenobacter qilianensis]|uniref:TonB-dependent receptor n=2 Tax=Hymenobacter qilianensis TaxID=1385715 RepID=A0A7H0GWI7_9BACT|nr:carboxypeptidase regulatory-like domain-containing protein [Hymenobacter qilianensis]QNP52653.1 TonB-dependent receptor [Hymenobacter qilianensis]
MKQLRLRYLLLFLLSVCTARLGWAQGTTTSAMTGIITDQTGAGLPGATVIAVHTPTNTQYVAPTNAEGRFNLQNMRVGGPYNVRVTFIGYQEAVRENITLTLGQVLRLDVNLSEATTQLAGVVVTGEDSRSVLSAGRAGSTTNVSTQEIERLPTISRNLNDFTRLTPQASSTSQGAIGGGNYRQNNITIDGSDFNNNFGIGGNLPAGGNPISLDAVSEITVNVTPFDVRQSNFIGSAVNAVTRSGTNDFSGSVYTYWRGDKQQGNKVGDETFPKQELDEKQYGFRLGGPVIKDKLFFFVNAEQRKATTPGQQDLPSTPELPFGAPGTPSNIVRPTAAFLDEVGTYLRDTYNYETGGYGAYPFERERTTLLGRLDWNISNNHTFSIRYNQVESKDPISVSTSRSPLTAFPNTRTSNFALPFKNSNYYQEANFYSLAAEWNGTFASKFYNTLRATYTNQNDPRSSDSDAFPFVDILDGSVNPTTGAITPGVNPITSFGYEPFTFGNLRDVETYSVVDYVNFSTGIHNLTGGFQFDLQNTRNGFQRFATSYYTFNSWDEFKSGAKPRDFALTYSLLPGFEQAFPRFKTAQGSLYAQDEINVTDKLRVTLGLRAELNSYLDVQEIQTHPIVAGLAFANGEQIDTGVLPKNRVLWSPRLGFNYDVKGDRTLQVRGGSGLFAGRVPTVWIVSQSGDAGLIQFTTTSSGASTPGPFNPDPAAYRPDTPPAGGTQVPGTLSATDRNFKNPQTWKSTLAVDAQLPFGIVGTLEGIYNKDLTIAYGRNPNLVEAQPLNVAGYPDNRPIYPSAVRDKFINPLTPASAVPSATNPGPNQPVPNGSALGTQAFNTVVLDNGTEGYYWSVAGKLEKRFEGGLFATVAYVRSNAKVLFDGVGDQLLNTWSITQIVNNANSPELSYANYVVPDRLIASLSYRKEYFGHLGTTISLFYEGSRQGRFSYIYGGDFNRDGQSNDLIYVPKDGSEIDFTDFNYGGSVGTVSGARQEDLFFQYIEQDDYLRDRKGQYAERNGALQPWRHQVDVKLTQDLFLNIGEKRNTLQFSLDIFNAGNLLNENWGIVRSINNSSLLVPTNTAALNPDGAVRPTFRLATDRGQPITSTFRNNNALASTYYMQFGLRYIFN